MTWQHFLNRVPVGFISCVPYEVSVKLPGGVLNGVVYATLDRE